MKIGLASVSQILFLFISVKALLLSTDNVREDSHLFSNVGSSPSHQMTQQSDTANIIAPGATVQLVSNQFSFTEGPTSNRKGDIYFTDQPNDKIWKYDTEGKLSVFLEKTGRSNGMYFDKKGNLISCADEKNQLLSITPKGKITVLLNGYQGHRFNGPNDLWVHPKGHIYFTDPYYQRPYWDRKAPELEKQNLYHLQKGKKEAVIADSNLLQPNGIIGSPDGKLLYVADIRDNKTYRYRVGEDGKLSDRQLFVQQGSDGMTIDNQGNVYLTGRGVSVYDPAGKKIAQIDVPAKWTANVCFGGRQKNILFITASESVYTLQMQVAGVK